MHRSISLFYHSNHSLNSCEDILEQPSPKLSAILNWKMLYDIICCKAAIPRKTLKVGEAGSDWAKITQEASLLNRDLNLDLQNQLSLKNLLLARSSHYFISQCSDFCSVFVTQRKTADYIGISLLIHWWFKYD